MNVDHGMRFINSMLPPEATVDPQVQVKVRQIASDPDMMAAVMNPPTTATVLAHLGLSPPAPP